MNGSHEVDRGLDDRHGGRSPSRAGSSRRLASVVAVLLIAAAAVPGGAQAAETWWKSSGGLCAGCRDADITRTALTMSFASGDYNRYIQAGAHQPGGWDLYGGYVQGLHEACHSYSGQNIGAMIRNPHTVHQHYVDGISGWISNGVGSYC